MAWHEEQFDDVVLAVDNKCLRSQWPLGRIVGTYPDEHGVVRSVLIPINGHNVRRPIHKLCLIQPARENSLSDLEPVQMASEDLSSTSVEEPCATACEESCTNEREESCTNVCEESCTNGCEESCATVCEESCTNARKESCARSRVRVSAKLWSCMIDLRCWSTGSEDCNAMQRQSGCFVITLSCRPCRWNATRFETRRL